VDRISEWRGWPTLVLVARHVVAVVVAGGLSGVVWLIVMQEGVRHGWMDHDYNQAVGELLPGGGGVAQNGLRWTMLFALGLAAVYALIEPWLTRGAWWRGIWWALVPFLIWGLVLAPLAGSRLEDDPGGLFGVDGGGKSILVGAAASVLTALTLARCYDLMRSAWWWRPRKVEEEREATVEALTAPGSLELPEERPEDRRVGP
jgi:hypothetical protein